MKGKYRITAYYPDYPGLDPFEDVPHEVTLEIQSTGEAQAALDAVLKKMLPIMYVGRTEMPEVPPVAGPAVQSITRQFENLVGVLNAVAPLPDPEPVFWDEDRFTASTDDGRQAPQRWPEVIHFSSSEVVIAFGNDNNPHTLTLRVDRVDD